MAYDLRLADKEAQVAEYRRYLDAIAAVLHDKGPDDRFAYEPHRLAEMVAALQRRRNALDAQVNALLGYVVRDAELEMQISALTKERDDAQEARDRFTGEVERRLDAIHARVNTLVRERDALAEQVKALRAFAQAALGQHWYYSKPAKEHGLCDSKGTPTPLLTGEESK